MNGVEKIANMDITEVKRNFFTLMSEIVKVNGDDQEGIGKECNWQTQLMRVGSGSQQGYRKERLWLQH